LGSAPFNSYKTKDGYVTIAVANNKLFDKFTKAMDRRDLFEDEKYAENHLRKLNEEQLNIEVEKWTSQYTTAEVVEILDAASVPVGPIFEVDDLVEDPHLKERGMLVDIPHPILGTVTYPGNPIKFSETSDLAFEAAPLLGEHRDYVLKDILKMDDDKIKKYEDKGIF
jgi:crotonobetainyl-CoA:carnitine CoA-transferase CaiB-like acyl-CoA transferase